MSVNQENVVGTDVDKVRKLLEESENELNLVSKIRPTRNFDHGFSTIVKKMSSLQTL